MSWKKSAWRIAVLLLGIFALYKIYQALGGSLRNMSLHDFTMWPPALLPLAASIVLVIAVNILHAILWRRIAVDLGSPAPNARATLHIYFVSGLSKYVVKLGQMAGLAVLAGRFGMAAGRATAAALLGQLIFLITGFLYVSAAMPGVRGVFPRLPFNPAWLGVFLAAATVVGTWTMVGTRAGHAIRNAVLGRTRGRLSERLASAFAMIDEAKPRDAAVWAAGYAVSWFLLTVAFACFAVAFYPAGAHHVRFIAGAAAASFLLGNFSPAQAGIGREAIMFFLLKAVMPATVALLISVLSRLWFMSGELLPLILIPMMRKPLVTPATTSQVLL